MKSTELRIGNYVKDPYSKVIKLVSVEKDASMLRPIPLTEEWLLNFGFHKGVDYNQLGISCGRMDFFWSYKNTITIRYNDEHRQIISVSCKYVHAIQNLYFAITGNELKQ